MTGHDPVRITDVLLNDARNTLTPNMNNRASSYLHQLDSGAPDSEGPYTVTSGKTSIEVSRKENIPLAAACLAGGRDATVHEAKIRALKQIRSAPENTYPFGVINGAGQQIEPPNVLDFVYLNRESERLGTQEFLQELAAKGQNGMKPFVYAIIGPEGAGKNEIVQELCRMAPQVAHAVPLSSCEPLHNRQHGIQSKYIPPAELARAVGEGRLFSLGTSPEGESAISLEKLRYANALVTDPRGVERLMMAQALHPNLEVRVIKVDASMTAKQKRMEKRGLTTQAAQGAVMKDSSDFADLPCDKSMIYKGDPQKAAREILQYMQNPVQSRAMAAAGEHIRATQEVKTYFQQEMPARQEAQPQMPQAGRLQINADALQSALSGPAAQGLQRISFADLRKQNGTDERLAQARSVPMPQQPLRPSGPQQAAPTQEPPPILDAVPLDQMEAPPEQPQDNNPLDLNELYTSGIFEEYNPVPDWVTDSPDTPPPEHQDEFIPIDDPEMAPAMQEPPEIVFPDYEPCEPPDEPRSADEMLPLPEQEMWAAEPPEPEYAPVYEPPIPEPPMQAPPVQQHQPVPPVQQTPAPASQAQTNAYPETYAPEEVYTDGLGEGRHIVPGTRISPDDYHNSGSLALNMLQTQGGINNLLHIAMNNPTMSLMGQMRVLVQAQGDEVRHPMKTAEEWAQEGRVVSPQATAILVPKMTGDEAPHRVYPQSATVLVRPDLAPQKPHRHPASIVYALTGKADTKLKKAPAVACAELKKKAAELAQNYLNTEQYTPKELQAIADAAAHLHAVEMGLTERSAGIEKPFSNLHPNRVTPVIGGLSRLMCCMTREMNDLYANGPRIQTKKKGLGSRIKAKQPKQKSHGEKRSIFSR